MKNVRRSINNFIDKGVDNIRLGGSIIYNTQDVIWCIKNYNIYSSEEFIDGF